MNPLVKAVGNYFPSASISYNKVDSNINEMHLKSLKRCRRTTLFVLHCKDKKFVNETSHTLKKIMFHSKSTLLVRLLIVDPFFTSNDVLKKFLHDLWKRRYLDVSILTSVLPRLSLFNKFTGKFSSRVVSSKSQWFLDKLRDLN